MYVATERPALAIILQNPPPLQRGIMERYGWWTAPFVMQIPSELNSLDNARKVKLPAVFILAGQSNMQGHAKVSTFEHIGMDPATKPMLAEMLGGR